MTPDVFNFLDYRRFLRAWFDARKQTDPAYSHATFARDGGCSRSALANVLGGTRRPRAATLEAFARAMGLGSAERRYLELLVELEAARGIEDRRRVLDTILRSERNRQTRVAESHAHDDAFRYLEHWYIPAVRELARLPGFRFDSAWVASRMVPAISEGEAREALERLVELGFLEVLPGGGTRVREIRFRTNPVAGVAAAAHFHRTALPELMASIDSSRADEQHLLAGTLAVPVALLPEVKAILDRTLQQVAALADAAPSGEASRVYQLGIQMIPVTGTT